MSDVWERVWEKQRKGLRRDEEGGTDVAGAERGRGGHSAPPEGLVVPGGLGLSPGRGVRRGRSEHRTQTALM